MFVLAFEVLVVSHKEEGFSSKIEDVALTAKSMSFSVVFDIPLAFKI